MAKLTGKAKAAFLARMAKGKKDAAKVTSNLSKSWGVSNRSMIAWLRKTIKTRVDNPKNYSSDYSRGELRGYKEALAQLTGKPTRFGR